MNSKERSSDRKGVILYKYIHAPIEPANGYKIRGRLKEYKRKSFAHFPEVLGVSSLDLIKFILEL